MTTYDWSDGHITLASGADSHDLQAAIDSAPEGGTIYLQAGNYTLDHPLSIHTDGISLVGAGAGETVFEVDHSSGWTGDVISVAGEWPWQDVQLQASAQAGDTSLQLGKGPELAAGDWLWIEAENTEAYLDSIGDTAWREDKPLRTSMVQVKEVTDTGVTLENGLHFDFPEDETTVEKFDPIQDVTLSGFSMAYNLGTPDGGTFENTLGAYTRDSAVHIAHAVGATVNDIAVSDAASSAFTFLYSADVAANGLMSDGTHNKGSGGNGYGVHLQGVYDSTFTGIDSTDMRHAVVFGSWYSNVGNQIEVEATNRDINFHGGRDHDNTVLVHSSDRNAATDGLSPVVYYNTEGASWGAPTDISTNKVMFDWVEGSVRDDVVQASDIGAYIDGRSGDDVLIGGRGADRLLGGNDDDTLEGGDAADVLDGGDGDDLLKGGFDADLLAGGRGSDRLRGGTGQDTLLGGAGDDILEGQAHGDELTGGAGDDLLKGGDSWDIAHYSGSREDTVFIQYDDGRTLAFGPDGLDTLYGIEKIVFANGDSTTLPYLVVDADTLDVRFGTDSSDSYTVDDVDTLILEQAGGGWDHVDLSVSWTLNRHLESVTLTRAGDQDLTANNSRNVLRGNEHDNVIHALAGDDQVYGYNGDDDLSGGRGNDTLYGGGGADRLEGGGGRDTLKGHDGADTFVVAATADSPVDAPDLIYDFTVSEGDRLDLSGIDADTRTTGAQDFTYIAGTAFTGQAGQLRMADGVVEGDLDGDGAADIAIDLNGHATFAPGTKTFLGVAEHLLIGTDGADVLDVDAANVRVDARGGFDTLRSYVDLQQPASVERVDLQGRADLRATGRDLDDMILGNSGDNTLIGLGGGDLLTGGGGSDRFVLTASSDSTADNPDTITDFNLYEDLLVLDLDADATEDGGQGFTWIAGNGFSGAAGELRFEDDRLSGDLDGNGTEDLAIVLDGISDTDAVVRAIDGVRGLTFTGTDGDDTYRLVDDSHDIQEVEDGGWDKVDSWISYTLDDHVEQLQLQGTAQTANGTETRNVLIGNDVDNVLRGEDGGDSLYGRGGGDRLYGGAGDDEMDGGGGDDILMGGGGHDTMYGGSGADEFEFTQWDLGETDTIAEFLRSEGDWIDLARIDADAHAEGNQAFTFVGTDTFSGTAGELRFAHGELQGDVTGDGLAELQVALPNTTTMFADDFLL
ncbi:calcium-binding protein [Rhodovibrio salinarum]|uniref:Peptidase M10 serralysin C-terminal domain-containing protein n=1 Tax=Rhodovibrio salinarum TaxID=1087 RepID=A0A934QGK5_9PROT|nr:calcium-binding protein [Rhodovibrio salinarum]MBK1696170.1 hypothetical protein [Rhodovibrio salinarum]